MNYYNQFPYNNTMYYRMPYMPQRTSFLKQLFPYKINFKSIINGTQRTLNFVNQTIPVIEKTKPMFNNARTMLRVMKEFKKVNTPIKTVKNSKETKKEPIVNSIGPTFFQ